MTKSELWDSAYRDGSVDQKLEWVREADTARRNWEPLFRKEDNCECPFVCGARKAMEPLPDWTEDSTEDQTWEKDLSTLAGGLLDDEDPDYTPDQVEQMSRDVMEFLAIVDPAMTTEERELMADLIFDVTGEHHTPGPEDALEWADGFELPESVLKHDLDIIEECNWDWKAIVEKKRGPKRKDRLSVERVEKAIPASHIDKDRAKLLAKGIKIPVDPLWKSNHDAEYPECSGAYKRVAPAVIKMFHEDFWQKGMGFFITMETARRLGVNTSVASWTTKYGKVKGRPISNHSRVSPGMEKALNSQHVKEAMEAQWGTIRHPTIAHIARMILAYHRDHPQIPKEDLVLWACDLKGAFTLLDIEAKDVCKLGLVMGPDLVWCTTVGSFGWTGTPFCFDVITRLCRMSLAKKIIDSYHNWFVDDGFGVGCRAKAKKDYEKVIAFIEKLLGPDAVAKDKGDMGRQLAFIGYLIDLDTWTLSVKPANLMKTLRGFFAINIETTRLTLKDTQRLASWASRYGQVCPYLTPFVRVLWQEVKKRHGWGIHADELLSEQGQGAVAIIRSLLLGSAVRDQALSRNLDTFGVKEHATVVCEYDACLTGIGVVWYKVENGHETPVGVGSWCTRAMEFERDSQYQNKSEFIAGLIAVMGLKVLNLPMDGVQLRGDSMTALGWSHSWSFKGQDMVKEALVYIHSIVDKDICMVKPKHIPGEDNEFMDEMSRRFEPDTLEPRSIKDISRAYNKGKSIPTVNWDLTPLWHLFKRDIDWSMEGMGTFWKQMRDTCDVLDKSVSVSH